MYVSHFKSLHFTCMQRWWMRLWSQLWSSVSPHFLLHYDLLFLIAWISKLRNGNLNIHLIINAQWWRNVYVINLWNMEIGNRCFNIVDMKPSDMEDLTGNLLFFDHLRLKYCFGYIVWLHDFILCNFYQFIAVQLLSICCRAISILY